MKKLYVGDVYPELATYATSQDKDAFLLTTCNKNFWLESTDDMVAYTSLGDLDTKILSEIFEVFYQADEIHYVPTKNWSDGFENNYFDDYFGLKSIQSLTEYILHCINIVKNNVKNLDFSRFECKEYLSIPDTRKSSEPQFWIVGTCIEKGTGVYSSERYGSLLEKQFQKKSSYLVLTSSSIQWQADKILRSEIKKDDIVIWGLANEKRFNYFDKSKRKKIITINFANEENNKNFFIDSDTLEKMLHSEHRIYESTQSIYQVENFCNLVGAKLLLIGFNTSPKFNLMFHNKKNFLPYVNTKSFEKYIDTGRDNQHPGPEEHRIIAKFIADNLKKLKYI